MSNFKRSKKWKLRRRERVYDEENNYHRILYIYKTGEKRIGLYTKTEPRVFVKWVKLGNAKNIHETIVSDSISIEDKVLSCKEDSISYPKDYSEFEIQSFIYNEFKIMNIDVRGEIVSNQRKCRFDLVVYVDKKPVQIIEVKQSKSKTISDLQHLKYHSYSLPVEYVQGMQEAIHYVDFVKSTRKRKSGS